MQDSEMFIKKMMLYWYEQVATALELTSTEVEGAKGYNDAKGLTKTLASNDAKGLTRNLADLID